MDLSNLFVPMKISVLEHAAAEHIIPKDIRVFKFTEQSRCFLISFQTIRFIFVWRDIPEKQRFHPLKEISFNSIGFMREHEVNIIREKMKFGARSQSVETVL